MSTVEPDVPKLSEEARELLLTAGALLLALQLTEKIILLCFELILQLDGPITVELLQRQKVRKRTLGAVLSAMRKQVEIVEPFDAALEEFLEKRNTFIHRLSDVPGWSLKDKEGIATANDFLSRLMQLNSVVLDVFSGLARAYGKTNPNMPQFPDEVPYGKKFSTQIDKIFFAKD